MDIFNIKQIMIPPGTVSSIHCGNTLLWKNSTLPDGYQRLTHIETTGAQYIDTGIMASSHIDGIQYLFRGCVTGFVQTAGNNYLFGCLNNGQRSGNISMRTGSNYNKTYVYIGSESAQIWIADLPELNTDFEIRMTAVSTEPENVAAYLNNTAFTMLHEPTPSPMPEDNIYLLWCKGVGSTSKPFKGKIYTFQMNAADGTPLRNFVPCRRVSDSVVGFYDVVGNGFYENIGTGTFTAGEIQN